ncbi:TetR family transcriptional regulator [Geobacillus subterraneus]|uniref:TetR family transcriptional regulator n=2 Tax=Geobacillus TaxID=129337 RepID=A0ABN4NKP6_9BACL|nr:MULTISPECIES: TetR/AcrR family transcriptional regulator [Geobacillus]AMX85267.1 TetR family transcriptional regulator [Geobacillus subterraneus]KZS24603.1 TetR family transcriptional regulator [Geobacillus subterraneus]OXB88524.1 TetR family transcriptional regulator [Geobacillus uzenensis]QIZ69034.1 TetR/AcrR family transcriptional regulator [Geobacillus subterraneus]WPZ19928.1 TetR/AcrR family transcriptional regulator [Geobacillus subterraneus]
MKEKLMEAGIELFERKGFKETSVQEIVEAVGATKGAFYYYYKSKEELLRDICISYIEDLLDQQTRLLQEPEKSCTEKLHAIVYMVIRNIRTRKKSARIFFREMRHLADDHLEEILGKRRAFRKQYEQLIQEGVACGEFKPSLHAEMITFGLLGITNWSYYWFQPGKGVSEEELTDIYVDLILNGIRAEERPKE